MKKWAADFVREQLGIPGCRSLLRLDKEVRRPGLGKVWTVLTNGALSLARLLRSGERTLREVHEKCHAVPTTIAERLGFDP